MNTRWVKKWYNKIKSGDLTPRELEQVVMITIGGCVILTTVGSFYHMQQNANRGKAMVASWNSYLTGLKETGTLPEGIIRTPGAMGKRD